MASKTVTAALMLLLLPAAARAGDLDGTQWKMRFRSAKAWLHVWKGDLMRFTGGKFDDTECGSYGFSEGAYGVSERSGQRVWKATRFNPDGERVDWEGRLEGDSMTGTFTWTRPDGQTRRYTFTAKKKDRVAAAKG